MKVLVACECSGVVREAFTKRGHDAWSCDLLPSDMPSKKHIQGDALKVLNDGWDLLIAHPPCTPSLHTPRNQRTQPLQIQTKGAKEGTRVLS